MNELTKLTSCPVCESTQIEDHLEVKDHSISEEFFVIQKCSHCTFLFTNPRPEGKLLEGYYQSEDYISHSDSDQTLINKIYKIARNYTLAKKVDLVNSHQPKKGRSLDIGSGTGYFLEALQKDEWDVHGTEPNESARELANQKAKGKVSKSIDVQTGPFQLITLWHVLEHLENLQNDLATISKLLATDGTLIIAVPNCESWDAQHYHEKWAAYDVPRHLYHFTKKTLDLLASQHQLKITSIEPMKLDSYYVSLLSEQYQNKNILNLPTAFIKGLYSNLNTKASKDNYSSLIYVLHK